MPTRRDVRDTYERIGRHFAQTRATPWPEVTAFLDGRRGDVGLDVGCGNGRHTEPLAAATRRAVGLDASSALLAAARERLADVDDAALVAGDAAALPVRDGAVDVALYVATLHHLPTARERRRSLDELARVLAPEGRALVSAWATAHERFDRESGFDTTVDWTLPDGTVVERFYHVYDPPEFRAALGESALAVASWEVSSGNCYAVVAPEGKRP